MQWLNSIVDELIARHPGGEILVETGASPSGTYHVGHMREPLTADAIFLELKRRGRKARHIHFVDDFDALRKIPYNLPSEFEKYLGMPLCEVPAPDGSSQSYGDYFLESFKQACDSLGIEAEFVLARDKYRNGEMVPVIERALQHIPEAKQALETISGRKLGDHWTPIQVLEGGRLKNRKFVSIDTASKTIVYEDAQGERQSADYSKGEVKLDWRIDWPGRWWLLKVDCEPSGRDHMTKGSSYDTGLQISQEIFNNPAPYPVGYDFINMAGDTKKMSASKGTGLELVEAVQIMPTEVMRYFVLRAAPLKRLYFDPVNDVVRLIDEFAAFAAKENRIESEEQLLYICTRGIDKKIVSRVPFSMLVASYQAALKDPERTLEIISRSEHAELAKADADIIKAELRFIDAWLEKRAPDDVKFALTHKMSAKLSDAEKQFLQTLAGKLEKAPEGADGAWFHQAVYELKDSCGLAPRNMFQALYKVIIGKTSGPRAGWFLSILPRDWLIKRLRLEV